MEKEELLNKMKKEFSKDKKIYSVMHGFWSVSAIGCSASLVAIPISFGYGVNALPACAALVTSMGVFFVSTVKCASLLDKLDNQEKEIDSLKEEIDEEQNVKAKTIENIIDNKDYEEVNNIVSSVSYDKVKVRTLKK